VIVFPTLRQRIAECPGELDDLVDRVVALRMGEPAPELAAMVRDALDRDLPADYAWPGNVRELEQAVRRILLTHSYQGDLAKPHDAAAALVAEIDAGTLQASELLSRYCAILYQRYGTYEEVARRTQLDRRTVKKHVEAAQGRLESEGGDR